MKSISSVLALTTLMSGACMAALDVNIPYNITPSIGFTNNYNQSICLISGNSFADKISLNVTCGDVGTVDAHWAIELVNNTNDTFYLKSHNNNNYLPDLSNDVMPASANLTNTTTMFVLEKRDGSKYALKNTNNTYYGVNRTANKIITSPTYQPDGDFDFYFFLNPLDLYVFKAEFNYTQAQLAVNPYILGQKRIVNVDTNNVTGTYTTNTTNVNLTNFWNTYDLIQMLPDIMVTTDWPRVENGTNVTAG